MIAALRKNNLRYCHLLKEGYQERAYNRETCAYILIHPAHVANTNYKKGEVELQNNIAQAMAYYNQGISVELLEAYVQYPSLDAMIEGLLYEFEAVTKNKANTIQHRILDAARQVKKYNRFYKLSGSINISIRLDNCITSTLLIAAIRQALYNGLNVDNLNFVVNDIIVFLTRWDLEHNKYCTIVQNALK